MKSPDASDVSVIIAAYNNFPWLRMCLEGLRLQRAQGFEIIIADDGSDSGTVEQINRYISSHPEMNIRHVWHADSGWRKNIALNNAVASSSGEYLLFIDADCIPAPDWVSDHLRLRRPDTIIAGRRITIAPFQNSVFEEYDELPANWWTRFTFSVISGFWRFPKRSRHGRVFRLPIIHGHGLLERPSGNLIGCNMGVWRSDLLSLNGFDERYLDAGLGEDIDLCVRFLARGGKVIKTPHQVRMVHRHHASNIGSSNRSGNISILEQTRANGTVFTPYGIKKSK